jgi:5-methylcytosine-specific restriction endonuclease McrA
MTEAARLAPHPKKHPWVSERNRRRWKDPEYAAECDVIRQKLRTYRTGRREAPRPPECGQRISAAMKRAHAEGRLTHLGRKRPNHSALMRARVAAGAFVSPNKGKFGPLCPSWRGGSSFRPYPAAFNPALKRRIRERDGNRCVICGASDGLTVHHVDHDKENCADNNLATACRRCNSKANYQRDVWRARFLAAIGVAP